MLKLLIYYLALSSNRYKILVKYKDQVCNHVFKESDFQLPLEKELRLKVIKTEIEQCNDTDVLKEQLTSCADSLMRYQHLLGKAVEVNLMGFIDSMENKNT